ncbi:NfeD family protein [Candidatus Schneideria nysicola]|uniref:NfeD family protein n=1 Tax=Candidatus Schneideria nysicola TaxID=1081631 RepID=UPI001CAA5172|nr:NfeD family protein [Candidatus Schneideria nysicola]UAJ64789.1 NfeD family protein [Candidatus Schneideria nysicola]
MGYLFLIGLSACITGLFCIIFPKYWIIHYIIFIILTIIHIFIWWKWYTVVYNKKLILINNYNEKLVGLQIILSEPVINHIGRVPIGDGSWKIQSKEKNISVGTCIKIVYIEGNTLYVIPQ